MTAEFIGRVRPRRRGVRLRLGERHRAPDPGRQLARAGGHQRLDPFVGARVRGRRSPTRIRLLTNLTVVPYRNPFLLAKAVGHARPLLERPVDPRGRHRLPQARVLRPRRRLRGAQRPVRRGDRGVPQAWTGEPVTYEGRHFNARGVIRRCRTPVQDPLPIWIGGNSKLTRRRVADRRRRAGCRCRTRPSSRPPAAVRCSKTATTSRGCSPTSTRDAVRGRPHGSRRRDVHGVRPRAARWRRLGRRATPRRSPRQRRPRGDVAPDHAQRGDAATQCSTSCGATPTTSCRKCPSTDTAGTAGDPGSLEPHLSSTGELEDGDDARGTAQRARVTTARPTKWSCEWSATAAAGAPGGARRRVAAGRCAGSASSPGSAPSRSRWSCSPTPSAGSSTSACSAPRRIDRSAPVVLKQLRDVSTYTAATGEFESTVDIENDMNCLPSFLGGERAIFVGVGLRRRAGRLRPTDQGRDRRRRRRHGDRDAAAADARQGPRGPGAQPRRQPRPRAHQPHRRDVQGQPHERA